MQLDLLKRPRRNRRTEAMRQLVSESSLQMRDFVAPLFVIEGQKVMQEVVSMPGVFRYSLDLLLREVELLAKLGVPAVDLFPVIDAKDERGSAALNPEGLVYRAVREIKREFPEMCVMVDVALDPYTSHGHDGLVVGTAIVNDPTVALLAEMSVLAAEAGADVIAPSDMMDGRVEEIRLALDENGFSEVAILSYAAKYASAFYGPFRDALQSAPKFGDKKTYQMDPANRREAVREAILDEEEGADMLLIKPALPYLDVIREVKEVTTLPVGAYQVSGEYAMAMAAGEKGWIDAKKVLLESLLSIKRAGADFIFTYAIKQIQEYL
ncbi:MAG: porphobilinogen synthase [Chlamydiia bacterium]|nr:porphobilinogen synthase [Chlamydiia bacterium]